MGTCKQLQTAKHTFNRLAFPLLTLSLRGRGKGEGAAAIIFAVIGTLLFSSSAALTANLDEILTKRKPEATIDLATKQGVEAVKGEWRYSDTKIIEVDFKGPGADGQPSNTENKAYDFTPHAGGSDFDDSKWEVIDPATLDKASLRRETRLQLVQN
jgi:hypothetical protein